VLATPSFSALAGFKRINQPNPKDRMAVQIYQLENGLTVYLTENHETPRFEAQSAVRAGSKQDPPESTGLAHYLEHMLFKGTTRMNTLDYQKEKPHLDRITELYEQHFHETDPEKRKAIYAEINRESQRAAQFEMPNEMDKLYKAMGEEGLNAHTWHEETVYQVNLPANRLEQWAILETERFQHPVFRLFQPELEIVYEEKNQTLDSKEEVIAFAVNKLLFKHHPYGQQTTIREMEHLKNTYLNLNQQQKVRRAASNPELNNDYGGEYLWGVPKKGQSLKEVEDLLRQQLELIRKGEFEDWIIPAIITDFKKNRKAMLEADESRVATMRNAFLAFQDWDYAIGEIDRIEKLTRQDVIRAADKYFQAGYVAGYRIDEQQEMPRIEKPKIDKIEI